MFLTYWKGRMSPEGCFDCWPRSRRFFWRNRQFVRTQEDIRIAAHPFIPPQSYSLGSDVRMRKIVKYSYNYTGRSTSVITISKEIA